MRKLIVLIFIVSLGGILAGMVHLLPYKFYHSALKSGVRSNFLFIEPLGETFYTPQPYIELKHTKLGYNWKKFHFYNWEIPLPIRNPLYLFVPTVELVRDKLIPSARFLDPNELEVASFVSGNKSFFALDFDQSEIFQLPIFRNEILKKGDEKIWEDLFSKQIRTIGEDDSFLNSLDWIKKLGFQKMVYNLFILRLRKKMFPVKVKSFSYMKNRKMGVISHQREDSSGNSFKKETFYSLKNRVVSRFRIRTKERDIAALDLRNQIVTHLEPRESESTSSDLIYGEFKILPLKEKVDILGLMYLFCAWTHDTDNKRYIENMVYYAERGKEKKKFLQSIYQFARKKFGSSFSRNKDTLYESPNVRLNRKISEENERSIRRLQSERFDDVDGSFNTEDEKVDFYLQKAKDSGVNADDEVKSLEIP